MIQPLRSVHIKQFGENPPVLMAVQFRPANCFENFSHVVSRACFIPGSQEVFFGDLKWFPTWRGDQCPGGF